MPNNPDWALIKADVIRKLRLLRAAWEGTAQQNPKAHAVIARDIYIPALKCLAEFSSCVQEEEIAELEPEPKKKCRKAAVNGEGQR